MNPSRPSRSRVVASIAVVAALFAAWPARAAESDPFRLDLSLAYEVQRFNSPVADSLGLSLTRGMTTAVGYDFRVLRAPMSGAERPALHVRGHVLTARRAFATDGFSPAAATLVPIEKAPVAELTGGIVIVLPMTMVDPSAGADFYVGYQGGLVLSSQARGDFVHLKQAVFGFERTRGYFDGSVVELAYGRNEAAGLQYAAKRWVARLRIEGRIGPAAESGGGAAAGSANGAAANAGHATRARLGSPLRVFADLSVDTDGRPGPDVIQARAGFRLDAGRIVSRMMGSTE